MKVHSKTCVKLLIGYLLVLILLIITGGELKAQTTDTSFTFTEEEVVKLDSIIQVQEQTIKIQNEKIQVLQSQLFNYKLLHKQDSLHISLLNQNVSLLDDRINLYIDLNKELRPKWYNKPIVHFFLGAVTITTSAVVLNLIQ
tara:strand:- start:1317 stop:1742 length:426 start_codon:yes stop_codon:yes gene_type:complete